MYFEKSRNLKNIEKKKKSFLNKTKNWNKYWKKIGYFSIFNSVKSPMSRKENVGFPDGPDFENSLDFRTVMSGKAF